MSGRAPDTIWKKSVEEGQRRLERSGTGLAATGLVGGVDVMLGVAALTVVSGALAVSLPEQIAHVGGSLAFGIGFLLIVLGRSELFTENFQVPFAAVLRGRAPLRAVARLWAITFVANLVAVLAIAAMLTRAGMVPPETLDAAGALADTQASRDLVTAFLSAVLAGTVMTLLTWVTHAVDNDAARLQIALVLGFLLAAPSLNHAVVAVGEIGFGLFADTTDKATWTDLGQNLPVSVLGNLVGGFGLVTVLRAVQVRGEPGRDETT